MGVRCSQRPRSSLRLVASESQATLKAAAELGAVVVMALAVAAGDSGLAEDLTEGEVEGGAEGEASEVGRLREVGACLPSLQLHLPLRH